MKTWKHTISAFGLVLIISLSAVAQQEQQYLLPYTLAEAAETHILPEILKEISALTDVDHHTVACVQDEEGLIFIYDLQAKDITDRFSFGSAGDYEGITLVGSNYYVLRSDGMIVELHMSDQGEWVSTTYPTGIPAKNCEGLCYDETENRLLIGIKGKLHKEVADKDHRAIYAFDLKTKQLSTEAVFTFDRAELQTKAELLGVHLPKKFNKKSEEEGMKSVMKLKTSAIAIHPATQELYLVSAADHLLFVFDRAGNLQHIESLDKVIFNKAEGITFLRNNELLISNEGGDGNPTLLRFTYVNRDDG